SMVTPPISRRSEPAMGVRSESIATAGALRTRGLLICRGLLTCLGLLTFLGAFFFMAPPPSEPLRSVQPPPGRTPPRQRRRRVRRWGRLCAAATPLVNGLSPSGRRDAASPGGSRHQTIGQRER